MASSLPPLVQPRATPAPPPADYPSTPAFTPSPRFLVALASFRAMHLSDPAAAASDAPAGTPSLEYHSTLESYTRKLSALSTVDSVHRGPGEALLLAANSQHIRRWEKPRKDWPEGLSGYKTWRTALNKFHADIAHDVMRQAGYLEDSEEDAALFARVRDLLLKRTLMRPPLPAREDELRDPEAHLFEDAICLTFLSLEFTSFSTSYIAPTATADGQAAAPSAEEAAARRDKLVTIVRKTWSKMGPLGRDVAVRELVGALGDKERQVVLDAVAQA
ncbi:uncharacterized protein JCM10292_000628 [Rhodotorula paludigena]|uniref:uncharacterized protein n=1 Tax=Rhodotorula paludigena TaxID=86838 RepID=UPI003178F757